MAKYYPINLSLENKKCLVIGGGVVAERKVRRLLEYGARVLVVSPQVTPALGALAKNKQVTLKKRKAALADIKGAYLVISAAADREINSRVSAYCLKRNILINVVDSPKECNFILPSLVRKGDLTISISTEGLSPALARKIRQELEKKFGAEYAKILRIMKEIRPKALKKIKNPKSRKAFFQKAVGTEILDLLRQNREEETKRRLECILDSIS